MAILRDLLIALLIVSAVSVGCVQSRLVPEKSIVTVSSTSGLRSKHNAEAAGEFPVPDRAAGSTESVPRSSKVSPNLLLLRRSGSNSISRSYAVIFDAGSSGSRVNVFCFDENLNLVPIGNDIELFSALKPGLSAYADDPEAAAKSLLPLLEEAEKAVPKELQKDTPVRVGATAGLRQLEGDTADRILQAVRDLLKEKSTFEYKSEWVAVLTGTQEGSYMWVAINYLLEKLGKEYPNTVGIVDLGGGSVQMAYAISETAAQKAPNVPDGEDPYVKEVSLNGTKYYLYVHSYLNYGLLAARAQILNVTGRSGSPCILAGYQGTYEYGGEVYDASASTFGPSLEKCRKVAVKTLKINETCNHPKCTFGGIWNGGGGKGQKNLYVASFFYDIASETGFIDPNEPSAKVRPVDFLTAAESACKTRFENAKSKYPGVYEEDLPFICMDLVYEFSLLTDGFGLDPFGEITLVTKVKYKNYLVGAAWPLGSALEVVPQPTRLSITS